MVVIQEGFETDEFWQLLGGKSQYNAATKPKVKFSSLQMEYKSKWLSTIRVSLSYGASEIRKIMMQACWETLVLKNVNAEQGLF